LTHCLHERLGVDVAFIGIESDHTLANGAIHSFRPNDDMATALTNVYRRGKPICGALTDNQRDVLLNADPAPQSAAQIPLGVAGVHGALILTSNDADHFTPDMGTLFLELTGEWVSTALQRFLGPQTLP